VEYDNLSVEEIERHLDEIEQNRANLKRALEVRRQEAKYELAQQLKDMILEHGYEVSEIASLLGPRKRRAPPVGRKSTRHYVRYVDPENANNVYVRGVLPGWMKEKMQEQGYDPGSKADREAFKANYLQAIED
jgi:DNA-binding protein H-NS